MDLDNEIWGKLSGGYKIHYNASVPLKQLWLTDDSKLIENIFLDLWDNLHHQGDVGFASYLALPQLVNLCINKKSFDWNYIGLCLIIEQCRETEGNPSLPKDFEYEYFDSLEKLEQYLLFNFKKINNPTSIRLTLALFATINKQRKLGKAILNLDEDVLEDFLEQF